MTRRRSELALRVAAVLALFGLAAMVWSVLAPRPMPVVLAMSVGQALGTLSFLIFGVVVAADLRRRRILDEVPDPGDPGDPRDLGDPGARGEEKAP
jgi:hypothetical protein